MEQTVDTKSHDEDKILRFQKCERIIHWALAIPFIVCYISALIIIIYYNPDPTRPFRDVFSWIHKISGICFIVLPLVVLFSSRRNLKLHFNNMKRAWTWTKEDFKWLGFKGLTLFTKKVSLPEQGKFNAAEKLNFMTLIVTYPIYILSGILLWISQDSLLFLLVHYIAAIISTPFLLGHTFMATTNPETRVAFPGMVTGFVDRNYVKHYHSRWYRENFKDDEDPSENGD